MSEVRILRARLAEKQVQITDLENRNKTLTVSNEQSVSEVENLVEEKKSLNGYNEILTGRTYQVREKVAYEQNCIYFHKTICCDM